jgi:nucleotide-binding universal stress UspA family protein
VKIICAVDGSEFSQWAVEALGAVSSRPPEKLLLVHVIDASAIKGRQAKATAHQQQALTAMKSAGDHLLNRMMRIAETALSQAVTAPHTKIDTTLAHGAIASTIIKVTRLQKADLTIIGSRGLSDIRRFLLGSVSRKVVTLAPCPVLVVKRPLTAIKNVVLAVDRSKPSRAAAKFLWSRFLPESARVTVLSVAEPPVTELAEKVLSKTQVEQLKQPAWELAREVVDDLAQRFLQEGYAAHGEVQSDHVTETILKFVTAAAADLLVVGSRGMTGSERLALGSVSEALVKYAPCSVLIVREWHG